ncbi:MAG: hypothetical protein ABIK09_17205 [Pseudomonadota bacterium]
MPQDLLHRMSPAAQTHAGFFTVDAPLLGYAILLDLCLTVLLFTLLPRLRTRRWDRVALAAPLVFIAWMFLTIGLLHMVGRPVFSVPSFFQIP